MRGKGGVIRYTNFVHRITPACAGKSFLPLLQCFLLRDHPRVCGEKFLSVSFDSPQSGSPPRVRGKGLFVSACNVRLGITPACAGKRWSLYAPRFRCWDHPRVCGEKFVHSVFYVIAWGSPPRVRGKGLWARPVILPSGITPACAGKSVPGSCPTRFWWDHPRVCGEKLSVDLHDARLLGSPPRVRGKDDIFHTGNRSRRITPACAGKRLKRSHSIGHFSCILCLFHSVLHRASVSGGSRAGPCAPPCLPAQNAVPV